MAFSGFQKRIERLIQGNPPPDEARTALYEIAIPAAKSYVRYATEGASGFDPKVAGWEPTRTVVVDGKKTEKPEVGLFEQNRGWYHFWEYLCGKVVNEHPDRINHNGADIIWKADDSFTPIIVKPDGTRHPVKSHERYIGKQDPSRWRQTAERCIAVLKVLAEQEDAADGKTPRVMSKGKPKVRRHRASEPTPLTAKQTEVVQIVGECKGNFSEAAKRLGKHHSTVRECYDVAMAKLGKRVVKHTTRSMPMDRRGQANVADGDDRRV